MLYREEIFRDYDHAAKRARGIGFTIDYNGLWYHHDGVNPGPIRRVALAALFGGAGDGKMAGKGLKREPDGTYWLAGPEERYRVEVEDVPFIITHYLARNGMINALTNFGERVEIGPGHPLIVRSEPLHGAQVLYVEVRDGLLARFSQAAYYDIIDKLVEEVDGEYVIRSRGAVFRLPS
jgi:hypothetical protein